MSDWVDRLSDIQRTLVVAVARNGVMGHNQGLPWRLSADLRRFRELTMGHALIMGRVTFASIGRPLPGRQSIILTRDLTWQAAGCDVVSSLDAAWRKVARSHRAFVIGGRQIYELALPHVDGLYWTHVEADPIGDTHFPYLDWSNWELVDERPFPADEKNQFATCFRQYRRRRALAAETGPSSEGT